MSGENSNIRVTNNRRHLLFHTYSAQQARKGWALGSGHTAGLSTGRREQVTCRRPCVQAPYVTRALPMWASLQVLVPFSTWCALSNMLFLPVWPGLQISWAFSALAHPLSTCHHALCNYVWNIGVCPGSIPALYSVGTTLSYDPILPTYIWVFPHFHFVSGKKYLHVSFKSWGLSHFFPETMWLSPISPLTWLQTLYCGLRWLFC